MRVLTPSSQDAATTSTSKYFASSHTETKSPVTSTVSMLRWKLAGKQVRNEPFIRAKDAYPQLVKHMEMQRMLDMNKDPIRYYKRLNQTRLRFQSKAAADNRSVPLYGGITAVGEYYIEVKAGGQVVRVQIDTGSSTTAFPHSSCSKCRSGDKRWDPTKSNSATKPRQLSCNSDECRTNTCSGRCDACSSKGNACCSAMKEVCAFYLMYGDGSGCEGGLFEDDLEWVSGLKARTVFGGILSDSPDFERPVVDGILGLAYPTLACNPTCVTPAFDSLRDQNKELLTDEFSVCITQTGGRLVLGEMDSTMLASGAEMHYVSLEDASSDRKTFYKVALDESVYVDGNKLPVAGLKTAIADSGTTLLLISAEAFGKIDDWLRANKCKEFPGLCEAPSWFSPGDCVEISDEDLSALPTLALNVGPPGKQFMMELKPEHYMVKYAVQGTVYRCVGIHYMPSSGGIDVILGNTVMMHYTNHYDRVNNRLGFGEASGDCVGGAAKATSSGGGSSNGVDSSADEGVSGCESRAGSCGDCSHTTGCTYNYFSHQCVAQNQHPVDSVIGFPWCMGRMCVCEDRKTLRFALLGVGVFLAAAMVGLLLVGTVRFVRRRRQAAAANATPLDYEVDEARLVGGGAPSVAEPLGDFHFEEDDEDEEDDHNNDVNMRT